MENLERLYATRFNEQERVAKGRVWQVLCRHFFQQFVPSDATTLDVACGHGEFSQYIQAKRKVAVDLNPASKKWLPEGTEFHLTSADNLDPIASNSIDVAFTSNFFEHLPSKAAMDQVLKEVLRVLKPGGKFIALQPNLRYVLGEYWDYYDHQLPLTDLSAQEGFQKAGFDVEYLLPKFLPFTTKSAYPKHPFFVRAYLAMPIAWKVLGKQFVIVGRKP